MDGDGRGGEGGGVFGVFGGGGAGGGEGGGGGGDGGGGWRRVCSARGRIPAAGGAAPAAGTRHEESNLEPRQLGAAGVDHHRGRSAQPPCQAAPHHGQPGQATAERAAQRRRPNGGVRPEAHTFDSRVMALKLPTSGTAPTLVQPESRAALLTCLGRQMGAHPPAADEAPAHAAGKKAEEAEQRRFGFPEPCTRRGNPPKQRSHISDLWSSTLARSASRPNFAIGAWRPQAQNVARHRLQLFDRRRGWGKASHRPPWPSAILATHRARGGQAASLAGGDPTGSIGSKQTDRRPRHAQEKRLNRFSACPAELVQLAPTH